MTTPEQQPDAEAKPALHLVRRPFTAEKLAELFKRLTGKDVTPVLRFENKGLFKLQNCPCP